MPFDPTLPQAGTEIDAVQMRGQLNGLKDLIDAIQTITAAHVDSVTTLPPDDPAVVTLSVSGGTLHFTFELPKGQTGDTGSHGSNGSDGGQGPQGIQGEPGPPGQNGEVSFIQLDNAIAGTSANSNAVSTLDMNVNDPPAQWEVQQIASKLDELILALRR